MVLPGTVSADLGTALFSTPVLQLPTLRYLSINSANPYNYFNFLLDNGDLSNRVGRTGLIAEAKKLINYSFLGISLNPDSFWVNLQPKDVDRMTSEELSRTDMGRVLLEQDLQLKKDVAKYLHPDNSVGKKFWQALYTEIGKDKVKREKITTSQRVWITPDIATVIETADGAFISEAKLKVSLESEYFLANQLASERVNGLTGKPVNRFTGTQINNLSERLMKEIIIPQLISDVNTSPQYAPLRQIYYSLTLAGYFRRKQLTGKPANRQTGTPINPYVSLINSQTTQGLESQVPWQKDKIFQEYLNSYSKGEYNLKRSLLGMARMYVSGGIQVGSVVGSPVTTGTNVGNANEPQR